MFIIVKYLNDILIVCFIIDISFKWVEKSSIFGRSFKYFILEFGSEFFCINISNVICMCMYR